MDAYQALQFAPLGMFDGSLGGIPGSAFGQQGLNQQHLAGLAGTFAPLLPFAMAPQRPFPGVAGIPIGQPTNDIGRYLASFAHPYGQAFGQATGPSVGGLAQPYLPFAATPQFVPQGMFGNILGQISGPAGYALGAALGQPGLGHALGGTASHFAHLLPFGMMPQAVPQFVPQGAFGNSLGQLAGPLGAAIGNAFGQPGLGQSIGGIAGSFAHMLPFAAAPGQQPVYH